MIELRGYLPADGWALAREGREDFLVRPPYTNASRLRVPPTAIEDALARGGYAPSDAKFDSWAALIAHLRQEVARAIDELGLPAVTDESAREFRRKAHKRFVESVLRQVRPEALGLAAVERCEEVLWDLLWADSVTGDAVLGQRVRDALVACRARRAELTRARIELTEAGLKQAFPHAYSDTMREGTRKRTEAASQGEPLLLAFA